MFPTIKNVTLIGSALLIMGFSAPCASNLSHTAGYTNADSEIIFDALGPTGEMWFSTEEEAVRFCPNQTARSEGSSGQKWVCHFSTNYFKIVDGHWVRLG